jgi:hypothetical protein
MLSDEEQVILDAAFAWADAVDAYEQQCRREHEPWRAYPEATGRRRAEEPGWVPVSEELQTAANRARNTEDALRAAIRRHLDGH